MAKDNKDTQKSRKRRTFWEPDSKSIVDWLDNQQNLGTSLQVIVIDAIRKYGNGDVVTTFFERREETLDESEVNVSVKKPKPKKEVVSEPKVELERDVEPDPTPIPEQKEKSYEPEPLKEEVIDKKEQVEPSSYMFDDTEELDSDDGMLDPISMMIQEQSSKDKKNG